MNKRKYYFDFVNELKSEKVHPVYFFTEEETLLKDKAYKLLLKKVVPPNLRDFNFNLFYGEECKARDVLETLQSPPVLCEKRLVILRNFQSLQQNEKVKILKYTENPIEDSVFLIESGKVNYRTSFYSKLLKKVSTYYFYHPYNEVAAIKFLQSEAKTHHKFFQNNAANLMVDYIGLSYQDLNSEFQKLLIHLDDKDKISVEDIKTCVGISKKNSIYELQNTLANKNIKSSLKIVENLLANGISEVLILIMLTRFFKTLLKISTHQKINKQDSTKVAKNLELNYFTKKFIPLAKRFQINDFPKIFHILLNTDQQLKSASIQKKIILEIMIYKICKNV